MSLAIISSSAIDGFPWIPSRVDTIPSLTNPFALMDLSSGTWTMILLTAFIYWRAFSKRPDDCTGDVPSLYAMAPLWCISYISASSFPSIFFVIAPMGWTVTGSILLLWTMYSTPDLADMAGLVLGRTKTSVYPPEAAASEPVSKVSLYSRPGSQKLEKISVQPGETKRPCEWITFSADRSILPISIICPSFIKISACCWWKGEEGSMMRTSLNRISIKLRR